MEDLNEEQEESGDLNAEQEEWWSYGSLAAGVAIIP